MKKRLLSFILVLMMAASLLSVVGTHTVYAEDGADTVYTAEETYTVKFAMPKEYLDSYKLYGIRLVQNSQEFTMVDTQENVTIDGTVYRIYKYETGTKPTNSNTSFKVILDVGTDVIQIYNVSSTQWYSDGDWECGEDIVAVPLDWKPKMRQENYKGFVKFVSTEYYTATFDLNGGDLTDVQMLEIANKGWKQDQSGHYTKQFMINTDYSTIISEWDNCSPAKAGDTFDKWIPKAGTLTADQTFTVKWASDKETPTADDFTFTAYSDLVYDGQGKPATVQPKSGITGMGAVTVWYSTDGEEWTNNSVANANTYKVAIDVEEGSSYTSVKKLTDPSWTFTITKAAQSAPTGLTATAPSVTGGNDGKISGTSDKMEYKSASASEYTPVSGTEITGLSAGTYKVRYKENNNYAAGQDAEVTVTDAQMDPTASDFTFAAPSSLTYDGTAKKATVTGKEGMGTITVKYFDKDGKQLASAPVDAGTYTVKIDVAEGTAYKTGSDLTDASWTFTITQAAVTVTAKDASKEYGAKDPEFTAEVKGTLGTDTVKYTVSRTKGEDAGAYTITPAGDASQGNYKVSYVSGTFTINPAKDTPAKTDTDALAKIQKEYQEENPGSEVKVEMQVSEKAAADDVKKIQEKAGTKKLVSFDASLVVKVDEKTVADAGSSNSTLVSTTYKFDFTNKSEIQAFRVHEGSVDELTTNPNADGEYVKLDKEAGTITVVASKYSTYAFAYKESAVPVTGDSGNAWLYIVIAVFALGAAAGAGIAMRKRANR